MSNDNKTLADVQPGGRVRLATVPYDRARDLLGDAYNAGTHGIGYSQQAMELHDAIIPAQPSPGGQGDALATVEELAELNRACAALDPGYKGPTDAAVQAVITALAARQPVGEPVARSIIEEFVQCGDVGRPPGKLLAQARDYLAAPPAQAVDLGAMPEGWRLSKKATCYQLSHGNEIIGNLVGPDAEENAAIIARVINSQAVGNG